MTPQLVLQASDRRLVWFRNGEIERRDDEKNKAVLWCRRLAFAYTGLAELGTERRTDQWLAARLSECEGELPPGTGDQSAILQRLTEKASKYFTGPRIGRIEPALRRHAFVAAGWARFAGDSGFSPYLALISNFHRAGNELEEATDTFELAIRRLERGEGGHVMPIGARLSQPERDALTQRLAQHDSNAEALTAILIEEIRRVARENETVGRGMLINSLPRASITAGQFGGVTLLSGPMEDTQTFLYLPPEDEQPTHHYGPTVVCGGTLMSNFTVTPL